MLWIDPASGLNSNLANYQALARLDPLDRFVQKQGRSTGRYSVPTAGDGVVAVYIKKYFRMPWWQRWCLPLDRFAGLLELKNLRRVARLGISVPEPIAAGADRRHPCRSLLAIRELTGYAPLNEFIPAWLAGGLGARRSEARRRLVEQIAEIARRLHLAQLYHRDFYLCHFFIRELPAQSALFDLVLIDLTRLKRSRLSRWRVKDLAQLLYSSDLPGISMSDRLRFFKHYLRAPRLDRPARRLLRHIERKAAGYLRHNEHSSAAPGTAEGHAASVRG